MKRKLLIIAIITLILAFGLPWLSKIPAFAGSIKGIKQAAAKATTSVRLSASILLSETKPLTSLGAMIVQPTNSLAQTIPVGAGLFKTKLEPRSVGLTLTGPSQVDLTKPIVLTGYLRDVSTGAGVANMTITISTGGFYLGQTHTDDQGIFLIDVAKVLRAGKYLITATFKGAHLLDPASAAVWVEVMPATVHIQTVPAIAGITFQMAGQQFMSGTDGSVNITIMQAGQYRLDVLLDKYRDASQEVEFGRWSEESYQPFREVDVPANSVIEVGLNIYHKVSMKFLDLDGFSIDPARITSISIRSVQGDVFTLQPNDTPWLPASRTARRQAGLEETEMLYSINSVIIDGSNVVNTAQQRFYARIDDTWTITLLLYSLNVSVRDGLFAAPIGKSINVIYPDGQIKNYTLDKSGKVQIHALARGIYHVSLVGVNGLGTTTPVALSRNQEVKVNVITRLDAIVVGAVGSGFAFGLVIYGRFELLKKFFRRKRRASSNISWKAKNETEN